MTLSDGVQNKAEMPPAIHEKGFDTFMLLYASVDGEMVKKGRVSFFLQGIAGKSLQEIDGLEFHSLEFEEV